MTELTRQELHAVSRSASATCSFRTGAARNRRGAGSDSLLNRHPSRLHTSAEAPATIDARCLGPGWNMSKQLDHLGFHGPCEGELIWDETLSDSSAVSFCSRLFLMRAQPRISRRVQMLPTRAARPREEASE